MAKKNLTYQAAGVDTELYEQSLAGMLPFVKRMTELVTKTQHDAFSEHNDIAAENTQWSRR